MVIQVQNSSRILSWPMVLANGFNVAGPCQSSGNKRHSQVKIMEATAPEDPDCCISPELHVICIHFVLPSAGP